MTRVGIVGVTGYAGSELARLLHQHPDVQLTSVASIDEVGRPLSQVFPALYDIDLHIQPEIGDVDIVFGAMPHAASARILAPLVERGLRVLDLSADFRLRSAEEYARWYKVEHPAPHLLSETVYGLPELHRDEIARLRLVAVPGCYPTSAILALAPAVKAGIIEPEIIVDSKSGVSGAGRGPTLTTHYPEANEGVAAYAVDGHRHLPEIVQELSALSSDSLKVTFTPHLMPMTRGIFTTCYAPLRSRGGIPTRDDVRAIYNSFYAGKPWVRIVDAPPQTKHAAGTNFCLLYPYVDPRTERLVVLSCIDNLIKGAAGQAVQDMNLMLGLPETAGLPRFAANP